MVKGRQLKDRDTTRDQRNKKAWQSNKRQKIDGATNVSKVFF